MWCKNVIDDKAELFLTCGLATMATRENSQCNNIKISHCYKIQFYRAIEMSTQAIVINTSLPRVKSSIVHI